jgi:hypothetical protein
MPRVVSWRFVFLFGESNVGAPRTQRTVSFDDLPPSGSGQCALNCCHVVGLQGEVVPVVLPGSDGERARPRAGVHPDAFIEINERLHEPALPDSERQALFAATRYLSLILKVELTKAS